MNNRDEKESYLEYIRGLGGRGIKIALDYHDKQVKATKGFSSRKNKKELNDKKTTKKTFNFIKI